MDNIAAHVAGDCITTTIATAMTAKQDLGQEASHRLNVPNAEWKTFYG